MSGPAPGIAMYENTRNDPVAAWPYDTRNILGATGRGDACTGTLTKKYHFCVQSPSFPMRAAAEAPGAPEALRSAAPQGLRRSGVTHTEVMRYMILHIPYNYMQ